MDFSGNNNDNGNNGGYPPIYFIGRSFPIFCAVPILVIILKLLLLINYTVLSISYVILAFSFIYTSCVNLGLGKKTNIKNTKI